MARWIPAACAALALASSAALAQSIGTPPIGSAADASSSGANLPPGPARLSAPSKPSKPMTASAPGSGTDQEGAATPTADPSHPGGTATAATGPAAATTTMSIGGSGSSGLAAMGGGIDVSASRATSQMGAGGSLMPDCPMGMVRYLGLCVTYDQARRAQMPKRER